MIGGWGSQKVVRKRTKGVLKERTYAPVISEMLITWEASKIDKTIF